MYMAGIDYDRFGKMTMNQMIIIANAYSEKMDNQLEYDNLVSYIQGQYIAHALMCTVGNMFRSKGGKAFEYPEKPFELKEHNLSEHEIELQRIAFLESLKTMQMNFEMAKEGKGASQ